MRRIFTIGLSLWMAGGGILNADLLPKNEKPGVFVVPGQEGMHRELIPKHITIVRCYYDLDVVGPGTTFGFDINGSGFDEAFYKTISIDADALDVTIKNLRLVTANQIHGQIEVGPEATTQYIHPKVIIKALPVFRAPEPFGVVRRGEVLDMMLTSIDPTGQWGRFRVITNLDPTLYSRFRIEPTNTRLEVSNIKPQYPFYVDGVIMIAEGLKHGQYGLVAYSGKRELFRQDPIVDVVRPNVGKTGSVEKVKALEVVHRPGDVLQLSILGSAFLPNAAASVVVRVNEFDMGPSTVTYVSAGQLDATLRIPTQAPTGLYGVTVLSAGKEVAKQPTVFAIVPANWLGAVKLAAPLSPGKSGQILLTGRDISPTFANSLELSTDSDDLKVSPVRWQSATSAAADITVGASLAPGDYIIHVSQGGKPLKLPRGNIIKITP